MKKLAFVLITLLFAWSVSSQSSSNKVKVDLENLAYGLVNDCVNIQENEIVFVDGSLRDLELLENIAVNIRKKGAFPLLSIRSDRMTKRMFFDVPEKYDAQYPKGDMELVKMISAQISISVGENPDLLADVPPERFAKRSETYKPVIDLFEEKGIRSLSLGNGLYPTEALADRFNISYNELNEIFWRGIDIDYSKLHTIGTKVKDKLKNGDELQIKHKNGTDFNVKINESKPFISDGVISPEDMEKGTVGTGVYLPAGEVYFAPVPGTANGKLVFNDYFFGGQAIKNLELVFENGKLVSMKAKSNFEKLKEYYDAQDEALKEFSLVDFGINPNVKIPSGSRLVSYIPSGIVTLGIGNNSWAGGENKSISSLHFFLPGSTVTIDGEKLVDSGELMF